MTNNIKKTLKSYFVYQIASNGIFDRGIFILFLAEKGFNSNEIGVLQSVLFFASFLSEIPTGIFGDKYGRKKSVFFGLLIFIGYCFGVISLDGFLAFALLYLSYGIAMAFISGSDRAYVYDFLKQNGYEKEFISIESKAQGFGALFLGMAIIVGGYFHSISWNAVYISYATSLMIALIAWVLIKGSDEANIPTTIKNSDSLIIHEAINFFRKREGRQILPLIFAYALLSLSVVPFYVFSQSFLRNLGLSVENIGWIFAIAHISSSLGYFATSTINKLFDIKSLFLVIPIFSCIVIVSNFFQNVWTGVLSLFLITLTMPITEIIFNDYVNQKIESGIRASANSLINFIESILISIGYITTGFIMENYGQKNATIILGLITLLSIPQALYYFQKKQ